ncbi:hypothetical protein AXY43_26475 [Clostridium sp. MF28]|uniref:hypothetical protein n=1 Tax=Clostridium TaxID=1485 RepID=UPI000CF8F462|nr:MULTISPECIES: hypothetical protein [Clostridium]AVK51273.1 hypothetical protein AXY43_26475 [Clostridium sp. MF28]PSM59371.1 hypothetical protein C4L39_03410 [Clostridium diolis]
MLKIQCKENNKFQRAKDFHKIKYYKKIKDKLNSKRSILLSGGKYTSEISFIDKIICELSNILIGDDIEIKRIISKIHKDYINIENNKTNIMDNKGNQVVMKDLIMRIFDYENFSEAKLYNESINIISSWKREIKNKKRKGFYKGTLNIIELRKSIINSINNMNKIYIGTKFEITSITNQWKNKILTFTIPNTRIILDEDLKIFDSMKLDLIHMRNEFWGNYNQLKYTMRADEVKLFWGGYNFIKEIGVMTCPYCNRIYTNLIIGQSKSYKPALDHFYPKTNYPYLALSLFNLIPSCNICNSSFKSDTILNIHNLYNTGFENDYIFKFKVIDDTKPITNKNIKIKIEPKTGICMETQHSINLFELESSYNTHKDIVVNMYKQRKKYSNTEIRRLIKLGCYTSIPNFVEQVVLNGPIDKSKFSEVPLAKFKRDIAYQVGFLNKL